MLEEKAKAVFIWYMNFGYALGWINFHYCTTERRVVYDRSIRRWRLLMAHVALVAMYELFLGAMCVTTFINGIDERGRIRSLTIAGIYFLLNKAQGITFKNTGEHHTVINAVFDTTERLTGDWALETYMVGRRDERSSKVTFTKKLLPLLIATNVFAAVARAIGVFIHPESKEQLTCLFRNAKDLPILVKASAAMLHLNITGFQVYALIFYGMFYACYVAAILPAIHRLNVKEGSGHVSGRKADALYRWYCHLSILQAHVNAVFGDLPLCGQLTCLFIVILNMFVAVYFHDVGAFTVGILAFLCLMGLFIRLAQVHSASAQAIITWTTNVGSNCPKWFDRFRQSALPLRVSEGDFYYVDGKLIMTILNICLEQTASLILAYK